MPVRIREESKESLEKTRELKVAMDDALEGYGTMLDKAEPSFRPTVTTLIERHRSARSDIEALLRERGADDGKDGSFMGAVHKTVVTVRAAVDDPDGDWIPGIVDGEERNLGKYDEAIAAAESDPALLATLRKHRQELERCVIALGSQRSAPRAEG